MPTRSKVGAYGSVRNVQTPSQLHSSSERGASDSVNPSGLPSVPGVVKQPKKGSFKEIMARRKAAQAQATVGTINHKPKEKPDFTSKKERKLKKKGVRDKRREKLQVDRASSVLSGNEDGTKRRGNPHAEKKIPQVSYGGTAKAKPQPSYRGTAGAQTTTSKPNHSIKPKAKSNNNEYAGTDDEIDSYEEDDGYGHPDDESDDMEAGYSDVEEEESAALRIARKEDEEEQKMENKLKREKEERRKKLEALSKKAKPQRY